MIRRLLSFIVLMSFFCLLSSADEIKEVLLERGNTEASSFDLGFADVSFSLVEYGGYQRADVTIVNMSVGDALLLFKSSQDQEGLKKMKAPKIKFAKDYSGDKGERAVKGIRDLNESVVPVIPKDSVKFTMELSSTAENMLEIPFYFARYNPKKLIKKGARNIDYEIVHENLVVFNIKIKGWTEKDPEYVSAKAAVEKYVNSLAGVSFCKNRKHTPSLKKQQEPYAEKKDSLEKAINAILAAHTANSEWMSQDPPYKKYHELLNQLESADLNRLATDCGMHKPAPKPVVSKGGTARRKDAAAANSSASAKSIYHQMQDTYIALRAGKLSKSTAVARAKNLMNAYQKGGRSKDAAYSGKISRFYNQIINY